MQQRYELLAEHPFHPATLSTQQLSWLPGKSQDFCHDFANQKWNCLCSIEMACKSSDDVFLVAFAHLDLFPTPSQEGRKICISLLPTWLSCQCCFTCCHPMLSFICVRRGDLTSSVYNVHLARQIFHTKFE